MSQTFRNLLAVGFLTLLPSSIANAEETPAAMPPSAAPSAEAAAPSLTFKRMWEIDGAVFKTLSSDDSGQLGTARVLVRRFLNDSVSAGLDVRFWPSGSYPLSNDSRTGSWAVGGSGQLYLFRNHYLGVYLGSSLLWVPSDAELALAPEVGVKWFATQRLAVGVSYWILSDLGSYTTSFEPPSIGKSRQSLGLEFSFYL